MRLFWGLMFLALAGQAWAEGRVRSLFVGIDHYQYTALASHDPTFHDLHGPVADVAMVKAALSSSFGVDVASPAPGPGGCPPPGAFYARGALSVTLTDGCATRANILAAFRAALAASAGGDTVLFYFAGHGSHVKDATSFAYEVSDNTIVQADARLDMNRDYYADIRGVELAALINRAPAGVQVVTIFDSCESAGATRGVPPMTAGVASREAPEQPPGVARSYLPASLGVSHAGYVHLAAAASGAVSSEAPLPQSGDGQVHGVFSLGLKMALDAARARGDRNIAYADVFAAAARNVGDLGFTAQQPHLEGDNENGLFLGRPAANRRVEAVASDGAGHLKMSVNGLSDITSGSVWGVFAHAADAEGGAPAAATAEVDRPIPDDGATLTVISGAAPGAGQLWARELRHQFTGPAVRLAAAAPAASASVIRAALEEITGVQLVSTQPAFILRARGPQEGQVYTAGGCPVGSPVTLADADLLAAELTKLPRYAEARAMADHGSGAPPGLWIGAARDDAPLPGDAPPNVPLYRPRIGAEVFLAFSNTAAEPRYMALIGFDRASEEISLIAPRPDAPAIDPGTWIVLGPSQVTAGVQDVVLFSSTVPITQTALTQSGVGRPNGPAAGRRRGLEGLPGAVTWSVAVATIDPQPAAPGCGGAGG